ncbi:MAG TPA: hypothetical protein VFR74_08965, partial [Jiangellales bacterium]|nr:hypothetical protein [Jiangellales bacterium]
MHAGWRKPLVDNGSGPTGSVANPAGPAEQAAGGAATGCAHPVAHALDGISDLLAGVAGVPLWSLDAA